MNNPLPAANRHPTAPNQPLLNTIQSCCDRLGIRKTKMFSLLHEGKLKAVKLGRLTMVPEEELVRYVRTLPAASAGDPGARQ